ncbi:MAG: protein kinase domain-containing protein [Luteolibacter sp.]
MNEANFHAGFTPPAPEHLADLFPGYQIVRLIACGGMGAVYEAVQIALDRSVAIKILPREFTDDESFRIGFQAEARAMARLNHPNLIGVYDFGEVDGMLYIIMEYVPGFSLFEAANGQPIIQEEVVPLVAAICRGLAHAHEVGIIHRDIKPANILLNHNNVPKIGDFGLARPLGKQIEEGEEIYGTPGYTAPEVVQTPQSIDHRADIFSLGVLLHELLTGLLPSADPRSASAICHCDPRFDLVIRKSTHPSPAERYHSANEITDEIEKISASAGPRVLQTATPVGRAPRITPQRYSTPKKSDSNGFMLVVLLIAVVVAGFLFIQKIKKPQVTDTKDETNATTQAIVTPSPPPQNTPPATAPPTKVETHVPAPIEKKVERLVQWNDALFTWDESPDGTDFSVKSGNISGASDSGIFKYEVWSGDGLFTLAIDALASAPFSAKAGLMIRDSLQSDGRNVLLALGTNGETILQTRTQLEADTVEYDRNSTSLSILRLHRHGNRITAVASSDGFAWIEIGSVTLQDLPQQVFVGFAAASATDPSAEPLIGRFQPVDFRKIETFHEVKDGPAPRTDMNALFQRARSIMKERATPIQSEFREQIRSIHEHYIQAAQQLILQLPEEQRIETTWHHSTHIKAIETNGFIASGLPPELAEVEGYPLLHNASTERQKSAAQLHATRMAELMGIYLTGIDNQIERSKAENDPGAVVLLEAEKERLSTLPYYFRSLME